LKILVLTLKQILRIQIKFLKKQVQCLPALNFHLIHYLLIREIQHMENRVKETSVIVSQYLHWELLKDQLKGNGHRHFVREIAHIGQVTQFLD
jgi:hypothetical protein